MIYPDGMLCIYPILEIRVHLIWGMRCLTSLFYGWWSFNGSLLQPGNRCDHDVKGQCYPWPWFFHSPRHDLWRSRGGSGWAWSHPGWQCCKGSLLGWKLGLGGEPQAGPAVTHSGHWFTMANCQITKGATRPVISFHVLRPACPQRHLGAKFPVIYIWWIGEKYRVIHEQSAGQKSTGTRMAKFSSKFPHHHRNCQK